MITGMLLGLLAGTGLLLLARGLRPPAPSLADRLTILDRARSAPAAGVAHTPGDLGRRAPGGSGWTGWRGWAETTLGAPLADAVGRHRWLPTAASSDLTLLGRSPAAHYTTKTTAALCGLALPAER